MIVVDLAARREDRATRDALKPNPHWLIFNAARAITGCACGFEADIDGDCGFGDSVVDHLLEQGPPA
jgi:hypothetical protein